MPADAPTTSEGRERDTFRFFRPSPALRSYILHYRAEDKRGALDRPIPRRILPDGCAYLIFRMYGADAAVLDAHQGPVRCTLRFVGARSRYQDIDMRRRARTLLVQFRPGGAFPFLQIPSAELADRGRPFAELWGPRSDLLLEQLAATRSVARQVRLLDTALLNALAAAPPLDSVVRYASARLQRTHGQLAVRSLAEEVACSARQLRNKFRQWVGLSPKQLARIHRLEWTLAQANRQRRAGWAALALQAGFADQAHMIREFQALLGESPERFVRQHLLTSDFFNPDLLASAILQKPAACRP